MNCRRAECAQPLATCPTWNPVTRKCWYYACKGVVHAATGDHACFDYDGDAEPESTEEKAA